MTKLPVWLIIATALDASPARADPDEAKRDEAALRAIDDHWGRAEEEGDVAYLAQLLAPGYRSIGWTGKATSVMLHGTVGIVSFSNPKRGADESVRGADVFVYEDNRWHAIVSLHNAAE